MYHHNVNSSFYNIQKHYNCLLKHICMGDMYFELHNTSKLATVPCSQLTALGANS